jgi:2-polyprenyl-3-methyl-5-hydroxy-6-metoxy-1,4-benzoquinol methylase
MDFERIEPGTDSWEMYHANHLHRYMFASSVLRPLSPRRVMDVACGTGYGTKHLAESLGTDVVGVDRDVAALRLSAQNFSHPRITWCADDCDSMTQCAKYAPFDGIVSLETVEHLADARGFVERCRALLSSNGVLVMSTPNSLVTSPNGNPQWRFHKKEYTPTEFTSLLQQSGLHSVQLFGQAMTPMGQMREQLRAELNAVMANPFVRAGGWLQRTFRGRHAGPPLPQQLDDFETTPITSIEECESLGRRGPFVLMCVARASEDSG